VALTTRSAVAPPGPITTRLTVKARATINDMKETPMKVTLTEPGVAGSYDVVENEDGRLVLEKNLEPSSDELHERHGTRPLTDDEFDRAFGDLPREPGE